MDVLGDGADLVVGEAAERVGDQLEVVGEVGRSRAVLRALLTERVEELGRAVRLDERQRRRELRDIHAPCGRSAEHPGGDVGDRVRDVRARQHRFHFAVLPVGAHDLRAFDGGRRVGEVVGERLVLVEAGNRDLAVLGGRLGEVPRRASHDGVRGVDGRACGAELV